MDSYQSVLLPETNGSPDVLVEVPSEYVPRAIVDASRWFLRSKSPGEDVSTPVQNASELAVLFCDDSFVCPMDGCSKIFTASRSYRLHKKKFHKLPRFNCVQCSQPYDSYKELHAHMDQERHVISCTMCPSIFKRVSDAANHYGQKHRTFKCLYCSLLVHGRQIYKEHLENHSLEEDGACYAASVLVETTMDTSFKEQTTEAEVNDGDKSDGAVQILEEISLRDIHGGTTDTTSESVSGDSGVQVLSERDCERETGLEEELSEMHPRSASPSFNLDRMSPSNSRNCSDTDTADTELLSDTESARGTRSVTYVKNPFFEPSLSFPIVFGPGADELLEDSSGALISYDTPSNNNQDVSEWIGHNVDMYQSMSNEHKKTFRFNCGKCALTFKNREQLKRHSRIHEHVCKHCFLRFTSLLEYKTHLLKHTTTHSTYICSVCGHNVQGVKSLMVHEMRHRLNNSFKCKLEDFTQNNSEGHQGQHECEVCKEKIRSLSLWLRHEIWHHWPTMWENYVIGRVFQRAFTEQDTINHEKAVEEELRIRWRDCKKPKRVRQIQASSKHSEEHASDDTILAEESKDTASESDCQSESVEDGTRPAVSAWMNYWCSYLGVAESPPSWVVPILKKLQLEWKEYDVQEHDSLYRKMDQIGVLIRSEKNGVLISEGPRVVLDRLPTSSRAQSTSLLRQKCVSPHGESHSKTASPSMVRSSSKKESKSRKRTRSSLGSLAPSKCIKVHSPISAQASAVSPIVMIPKIVWPTPKHGYQSTRILDSPVKSMNSSKDPFITPPSSPSSNALALSPTVVLTKLLCPPGEQSSKVLDRPIVPSPPSSINALSSSPAALPLEWATRLSSPSLFLKLKWLTDQTGTESLPKWAHTLAREVHHNTSLSLTSKIEKMHQIKNLIKLARGDKDAMRSTPVVDLLRLSY
ncbi:hypothetical protein ONE63_003650 [Megalurothrips usitatus]|uniref:C2H2-type domain-containing protein n=1 Tax=Megalurothrips usitatus TaxID=439358 RepID=A0AAV7X7L5_9NEOP|nr:hypothetical protein ONE63_003650 [Megalurothrips usitatus]KAJ1520531.1 hypothetical protein ONE63_003650 [Megalurothrips usitatus]